MFTATRIHSAYQIVIAVPFDGEEDVFKFSASTAPSILPAARYGRGNCA